MTYEFHRRIRAFGDSFAIIVPIETMRAGNLKPNDLLLVRIEKVEEKNGEIDEIKEE